MRTLGYMTLEYEYRQLSKINSRTGECGIKEGEETGIAKTNERFIRKLETSIAEF